MILNIKVFRKELSARDNRYLVTKNNSIMEPIHELFICQCNNTEHQLIFSYFSDDEDKDVFVSVHLLPEYNIWKRIKMAIKYIFGYRCRYGHFDEFIFKKEDVDKLQTVVNYLKS